MLDGEGGTGAGAGVMLFHSRRSKIATEIGNAAESDLSSTEAMDANERYSDREMVIGCE